MPLLSRRALIAGSIPMLARSATPAAITLKASDGAQVFAWHYAATGPFAILLFHQAGSNHAEYATIAPRLNTSGFDCLAMDQRSGGRMWGVGNQSAAKTGSNSGYLSALPDLDAAVEWALTNHKRPIIWGSSYSAALSFLLAARRRDLAAVLAFSPGEYLDEPHQVEQAAGRVTVPVFIDSAKDEQEIAIAKVIATACHGTQFIPSIAGVHGSSTLRTDRNAKGAEENWKAVEAFLAQFKS